MQETLQQQFSKEEFATSWQVTRVKGIMYAAISMEGLELRVENIECGTTTGR